MVKVGWLEEFAIYIVIGGIMLILVRFMQTLIVFSSWVWIVIFLILYLGISSLVLKLIRGKDKEKENKALENWWKKQKTWEKVIIILGAIILVIMLWNLIFGV